LPPLPPLPPVRLLLPATEAVEAGTGKEGAWGAAATTGKGTAVVAASAGCKRCATSPRGRDHSPTGSLSPAPATAALLNLNSAVGAPGFRFKLVLPLTPFACRHKQPTNYAVGACSYVAAGFRYYAFL
jgi:hypothetical protein